MKSSVDDFQLSLALREIWEAIGAANRYIVTREPWVLAKDPARRAELDTALGLTADAVRVIAELIRPFMPGTGERTLRMLGLEPSPQGWTSLAARTPLAGTRIGKTEPLFPRIDQTVEELRQMAADQQEPAPTAPVPAPAGPAQPAAAVPAAGTDRISIDDFMKIELRVAKVLAAERVPNSKKLLKLQVDVGTEHRTLVAGIADAYEPEALVGRSVVIVFNLKPAKLMGIESNGMVLAASADGGKAIARRFRRTGRAWHTSSIVRGFRVQGSWFRVLRRLHPATLNLEP